jgi:hypothetical protein
MQEEVEGLEIVGAGQGWQEGSRRCGWEQDRQVGVHREQEAAQGRHWDWACEA